MAFLRLFVPRLRKELASYAFEAEVLFDEGDQVVAGLPRFGLGATGTSVEAAVEGLRARLDDYAANADRYLKTDRHSHAPWILRYLLTPEDEQSELL